MFFLIMPTNMKNVAIHINRKIACSFVYIFICVNMMCMSIINIILA